MTLEDIDASRGILIDPMPGQPGPFGPEPIAFIPPIRFLPKDAIGFLSCVTDPRWREIFESRLRHIQATAEHPAHLMTWHDGASFQWHFACTFIGDGSAARRFVSAKLSREVRGWRRAGAAFVRITGYPFADRATKSDDGRRA